MACDINIGFGKVKLRIRREGSVWANKEECVAFRGSDWGEERRRNRPPPKKKKILGRKEASELLVLSDIPLCSHNVCFLFVRGCFELKQAWATIIGSSHLVWFVETAHQFSVSNSNTSKHFEAISQRWTRSSGICIRWELFLLLQSLPDLLYSLRCLLF